MKRSSTCFFLIIVTLLQFSCSNSKQIINKRNISFIYKEDFDRDLKNWTIEKSEGNVFINKDLKLEIDVSKGVSIWFNKKITDRNYTIEYEATAIDNGKKNDRVSDMNCFWKAKDPQSKDDIFKKPSRNGDFNKYDSLELYYCGIGVHNNSKTRFRKYDGRGNKPLLPKHDLYDKKYLLEPNKTYTIKIVVKGNRSKVYKNGTLLYNYLDTNSIEGGWFAFRTFKSHLIIDNFRIYIF